MCSATYTVDARSFIRFTPFTHLKLRCPATSKNAIYPQLILLSANTPPGHCLCRISEASGDNATNVVQLGGVQISSVTLSCSLITFDVLGLDGPGRHSSSFRTCSSSLLFFCAMTLFTKKKSDVRPSLMMGSSLSLGLLYPTDRLQLVSSSPVSSGCSGRNRRPSF